MLSGGEELLVSEGDREWTAVNDRTQAEKKLEHGVEVRGDVNIEYIGGAWWGRSEPLGEGSDHI